MDGFQLPLCTQLRQALCLLGIGANIWDETGEVTPDNPLFIFAGEQPVQLDGDLPLDGTKDLTGYEPNNGPGNEANYQQVMP